MAAQHIGQSVSKDMAIFVEAGAPLTAPQQIARRSFGFRVGPLIDDSRRNS